MISHIALCSTLILAFVDPLRGAISPTLVMTVTLWITGFLFLLNIALALFFRQQPKKEVISYYVACCIELLAFAFALLFSLGAITQAQIPFHLPAHLPVNLAEIGAALTIGLGLFPAAYWHRINLAELPERIAEDGKTLKASEGGVHVHKNAPGEWMN